jgi:hypothetical protein
VRVSDHIENPRTFDDLVTVISKCRVTGKVILVTKERYCPKKLSCNNEEEAVSN